MFKRRAHREKNSTTRVYKNIKHNYDAQTNKYIKHYQHITKQVTRLTTSTKFLERCRRDGLTPNFIDNATKNIIYVITNNTSNNNIPKKFSKVVATFINNVKSKLINLLINIKHEILRHNKKEVNILRALITQCLEATHSTQFFQSEELLATKQTAQIKTNQIKKYENLKSRQRENLNIRVVPEWFHNISSIDFPTDIRWLLSLGPKYALPIQDKEFPLFQLIADGENVIRTIEDKEKQEIGRSNFTKLIHEHLNRNKISARDKFINKTVLATKTFLKKNKDILILNADKGNVTVALEKAEYDRKMQTIVNNISTYRVLKRDPTSKLQEKNNALVQKMLDNGVINEIEKQRLLSKTANPPRIYGLPKIHKEGAPLRPICSSICSPSYELCKYVVNILENITKSSKFNVKDAIEFKRKINNTYIYDDEILVSFDVVSLFPSIPVDLALKIISSKWNELKDHTKLTQELFLNIVKFCIMENRYFKYNEKIYEQRSGMPMGSPASPVVADIVMEELLSKFMMETANKPRLLTKYVDDLFAIVRTQDVDKMLNDLNNFNKSIQFTIETEKDGELPYLDTLIIRKNNKLLIDWYKKPTASGRLINFNSKHDKKTIINTASNFIRRVLSISDTIFHGKNIDEIKVTLTKNDFPMTTIKQLLRTYFTENKERTNIAKGEGKIYKSVVHVPGITERIKFSKLYDRDKYQIASTYKHTLRKLYSNTKDRIPKQEKSDVVYRIPCNGDGSHLCKKVYVGTTKMKLKTRISAHRSNVKLRSSFSDNKTALSSHCKDTGHYPDFDNVSILHEEKNYGKRYTLEMLHITNTPNDTKMNYKIDTDQLARVYRDLVLRQQHCSS
ncbi:uncharacterized protein [Eurosta solidaginis]|uniref:uncharacterized protein n=1 Tax=Eurosta solidaginis TaxID=178769 RepID=UPI0035316F08